MDRIDWRCARLLSSETVWKYYLTITPVELHLGCEIHARSLFSTSCFCGAFLPGLAVLWSLCGLLMLPARDVLQFCPFTLHFIGYMLYWSELIIVKETVAIASEIIYSHSSKPHNLQLCEPQSTHMHLFNQTSPSNSLTFQNVTEKHKIELKRENDTPVSTRKRRVACYWYLKRKVPALQDLKISWSSPFPYIVWNLVEIVSSKTILQVLLFKSWHFILRRNVRAQANMKHEKLLLMFIINDFV